MSPEKRERLYFLAREIQKSLDVVIKEIDDGEVGLSLLSLIRRVEDLSSMARRV
mgnify:CR=1 FL=1